MDKCIPRLINATALPNYKMQVEFEDEISGVVDLSHLKGIGVFEYWNIEANFYLFRITENKKLEWSEDLDMDPDSFYLRLIGKTFEEYSAKVII